MKKPDAHKIEQYQAELKDKRWEANFLFHFTDIENAIGILNEGYIYSRNEAIRKGLMFNDNASPEVIQNTQHDYKDFARLYYRPKTFYNYLLLTN